MGVRRVENNMYHAESFNRRGYGYATTSKGSANVLMAFLGKTLESVNSFCRNMTEFLCSRIVFVDCFMNSKCLDLANQMT